MLKIIGIGAIFIMTLFAFFTSGKINSTEFIGEIPKNYIQEIFTNSGEKVKNEFDLIALEKAKVKHVKTPKSVKSIYFTAGGISYTPKKNVLLDLVDNYEINSVIVDVKTVSGYTSFEFPEAFSGSITPVSNNQIKDIKTLIEDLHERDVYVIARIVVFKDKWLSETRPDLALKRIDNGKVWTDYKGLKYLDAGSKEVWDYNIELASKSYELGFDEINFDYVRFPSDGNINNINYHFEKSEKVLNPKFNRIKILDKFSTYITKKLREKHPEIVLSADVFGLVTKHDIYSIGQNLESFAINFDYVAPMVYPSHYGRGYLGFDRPDNHPYEILTEAFNHTNAKIDKLNEDILQNTFSGTTLKINSGFIPDRELGEIKNEIPKTVIRPWIQGFSHTRSPGYTPYNREKFRKQISAIIDAGLNSYFVWNSASNYYKSWYNKKEEAAY